MTRCLAPDCQMGGLGCDNMTVVLICFLHGKQYEDLADKCAIPYNLKSNSATLSSSSSTSSSTDEDMHELSNVNSDAKSRLPVDVEVAEAAINDNETYSKLNTASATDNGLAVA